jgi:hypothetical protein
LRGTEHTLCSIKERSSKHLVPVQVAIAISKILTVYKKLRNTITSYKKNIEVLSLFLIIAFSIASINFVTGESTSLMISVPSNNETTPGPFMSPTIPPTPSPSTSMTTSLPTPTPSRGIIYNENSASATPTPQPSENVTATPTPTATTTPTPTATSTPEPTINPTPTPAPTPTKTPSPTTTPNPTPSPTPTPTSTPTPTATNLATIPWRWPDYSGNIIFGSGTQICFLDTSVTHNGNPSIRLEKHTSADTNYAREVNCKGYNPSPGDHIVVKIWVKTDSTKYTGQNAQYMGARLGVDFYARNGNGPNAVVDSYPHSGTEHSENIVSWGTTTWTQLTWDIIIPSTTYTKATDGTPLANPGQIVGMVVWIQALPANFEGVAWFADAELYINP